MFQFTAIRAITQRHKYRWHVTTDKYIIMFLVTFYQKKFTFLGVHTFNFNIIYTSK